MITLILRLYRFPLRGRTTVLWMRRTHIRLELRHTAHPLRIMRPVIDLKVTLLHTVHHRAVILRLYLLRILLLSLLSAHRRRLLLRRIQLFTPEILHRDHHYSLLSH